MGVVGAGLVAVGGVAPVPCAGWMADLGDGVPAGVNNPDWLDTTFATAAPSAVGGPGAARTASVPPVDGGAVPLGFVVVVVVVLTPEIATGC